jgi:hypothetical protein
MEYSTIPYFVYENFDKLALGVPAILIIGRAIEERKRLIRNIMVCLNTTKSLIISKEVEYYLHISDMYNINSTVSENYHDVLIDGLRNEQIYNDLPKACLVIDNMLQYRHVGNIGGSFANIVNTHKVLNITPLIVTVETAIRFIPSVLTNIDFVILMHESCPHKLNEMYTDFGSLIFPMYADYLSIMEEMTRHNKNLLIQLKTKKCYLISTMSI